jgi:hypothetical protein
MGKALTVREVILKLGSFDPDLQVWAQDESANDGYVPVVGVFPTFDETPAEGDPAEFVALATET